MITFWVSLIVYLLGDFGTYFGSGQISATTRAALYTMLRLAMYYEYLFPVHREFILATFGARF